MKRLFERKRQLCRFGLWEVGKRKRESERGRMSEREREGGKERD